MGPKVQANRICESGQSEWGLEVHVGPNKVTLANQMKAINVALFSSSAAYYARVLECDHARWL